VEGLVVDQQTREPLIGASISIEKGITATVSDVDGKFILFIKSFPTSVSVSYLGYNTKEVRIEKGSASITVALEENVGLLDEVVIVGYGTQRRKDITGSITSLPKSVLEHVTPTFDGMLGGAVAGLNVTQASGQPGSGSEIRIRGGNSLSAGNEPLYVIDGFLFYNNAPQFGAKKIEESLNPLAAINPSDIESIEVLKDVSATAIYGSRGSNGVIIVSTKKGERNSNHIHYQSTVGWSQISKKLALLNANQWATLQNEFGYHQFDSDALSQLGVGANWQDAVFRTGISKTHELSIRGGEEKTRYLLSGNYTDQEGILLNTDFERYNFRLNLDRDVFSNFSVGVNLTAGKFIQNSVTAVEENDPTFKGRIINSLGYALRLPPVVPIYNEDGSYNYNNPYEKSDLKLDGKSPNPVSDLNNSEGKSTNTSLLGSFFATYTLLEGLTAKINIGVNLNNVEQKVFAPSTSAVGLPYRGYASIGNSHYESTLAEYTLDYAKRFHSIHFVDILVGYTTQRAKDNFVITENSKFTNEKYARGNIYDGNGVYTPTSGNNGSILRSGLGRVNYSLLERYHLTASFRGDESTRLAPGHRWAYYPSVGLSWNINEEQFLQTNKIVDILKIRLTAGSVGNQDGIGNNLYADNYVAKKSSSEGQLTTTYEKIRLGNPNLRWESTVSYDAGIDIGIFNNRLSLVADVYSKKTSDLLFEMPIDPTLGKVSQMTNIGNVTNKGVELSVNGNLIEKKHFYWNVSANIAHNVNKITKLGKAPAVFYGRGTEDSEREYVLKVGESLGSFYGYVFNGVVQTDEDVSKLPVPNWKSGNPEPGDPKFADISGSQGIPDGTVNSSDRVILGNIQPDFTYGLSSSLTYHDFDFFISFQGSQGNQVYNKLRRQLETPNEQYNMSAALLDRWTSENPSKTIPRADVRLSYSVLDSRFVEDASFLRLKNLTLGYTLPVKISQAPSLKFRIFATAQNLLTLTKYKGYDPEVADGIDLGVYPKARTFSVGAGVSF
jgi:TonB-linked SusC/RagA family outer membrane protein